MPAIPDSTLPGHKQLHERVVTVLDLCQESRNIDFKESAPWLNLQVHIARTSMAMTNLRDGGIIIIGVGERGESWSLDGISTADIATYDEDNVNDFINKYASPTIRVELVRVTHNGRVFLAIRVPEFEWSPVICKRNGQDSSKLRKTAIYVRTGGKPQTIPASEASQIDELVELAAEKRARRMISVSQSIGMVTPPSSKEKADVQEEFREELEGL
jgi:predicted HTH transcriptional regulator